MIIYLECFTILQSFPCSYMVADPYISIEIILFHIFHLGAMHHTTERFSFLRINFTEQPYQMRREIL